jgi:hypothetical protein
VSKLLPNEFICDYNAPRDAQKKIPTNDSLAGIGGSALAGTGRTG